MSWRFWLGVAAMLSVLAAVCLPAATTMRISPEPAAGPPPTDEPPKAAPPPTAGPPEAGPTPEVAPPEPTPRPEPTPPVRPTLGAAIFPAPGAHTPAAPSGGDPAGRWHFYHEVITLEAAVSEPVAVSGAPYFELLIGAHTRRAAYHSGSGSARLVFQYRVQADDYDGNGVAIPAHALKLNGGRIAGASGALSLEESGPTTARPDDGTQRVDGAQGHRHPRFPGPPPPQVYAAGRPIPELTLPAASPGNGALSYSARFALDCTGGDADSPGGSSGGGGRAPVSLRDWMIYTPPGPGDTHGGRISAAPDLAPDTFQAPTAGLRGCVSLTVRDADADRSSDDADRLSFNIAVKFDYDRDDNGLIEIDRLSQLDAIRYDLDGDGAPDAVSADDWANYAAAFPDAMPGMGCPAAADTDVGPGPCAGYELTASLDFDTNRNGYTYTETGGLLTGDAGDAYYNGGAGWNPLSSEAAPFTATLDGQGHTIANLFIHRDDETAAADYGLFGFIRSSGQVRNLGLVQVKAVLNRALGNPGASTLGSLAGVNGGTVANSYATGALSLAASGRFAGETPALNIGGLLGGNHGTLESSYAAASVAAVGRPESAPQDNFRAGGLVGRNGSLGKIIASYAAGPVRLVNGRDAGGLVGSNTGEITASYAVGAVAATGGQRVGGLVGFNWKATARITASYAAGLVTADAGTEDVGGMVGWWGRDAAAAESSGSYWDTGSTGQRASKVGLGQTTRQLQTPTGYTGLYAHWNLDLDGDAATGDASGNDAPWDFGAGRQYPVLQYGGLSVAQQRRNFPVADNWNAPAVGDPVLASAELPAAAWQWQRETDGVWSDIPGAAHRSYLAAAADVGRHLRAVATYPEGGLTRTLITANTGAAAAAPPAAASVTQLTSAVGSAALHLRLDPAANIAAADTGRWRWLRCDTAEMTGAACIVAASSAPGRAAASYTPTADDAGKYLQAQLYYAANDEARTWTRTRGPVLGPVIAAAAPPPNPAEN